MTTDQ